MSRLVGSCSEADVGHQLASAGSNVGLDIAATSRHGRSARSTELQRSSRCTSGLPRDSLLRPDVSRIGLTAADMARTDVERWSRGEGRPGCSPGTARLVAMLECFT